MNASFGDVFNQGKLRHLCLEYLRGRRTDSGKQSLGPQRGYSGRDLKYENLARDLGVELGGWSFGAQFGDMNNDGNLDLYLDQRLCFPDRKRSYWYDFTKSPAATAPSSGTPRTGLHSMAAASPAISRSMFG